MAKVPVFISYHGSDIQLATDLRRSLKRLSSDFDVFLDKYSIRPADDYEQRIAIEIARAEWFLIVCTGFPHRDADMLWSFFEAGQFRATLPEALSGAANKRIVCLYDNEPPAVLSRFQGVKVEPRQVNGASIDTAMQPASENNQLDSTAIAVLLEDMLTNAPLPYLRDVRDDSTRGMLREEARRIIQAFESSDPGKKIDERALQPRISFELQPGQALTDATTVKGYEQSLRVLFGIESEQATWDHIVGNCSRGGIKPIWISDVEAAASTIMKGNTPSQVANKCVLRDEIYRVFVARYEIYKDRRRAIYVVFLPAASKSFDLTRRSSMILSALILSVRFREQVIPQVRSIATAPDVAAALLGFYRNLIAIEIEAKQFGLQVDSEVDDEAPLAGVMADEQNRREVQAGIASWKLRRAEIERMFSDVALLPDRGTGFAARLSEMMDEVRPTNRRFVEILAEEMLRNVSRERDADLHAGPAADPQ